MTPPLSAGQRAALPAPSATPPTPGGGGGFDPGEHTIPEVFAYLREHPDQLEAVYQAELAGKARTTLLEALEAQRP